MSLLAWILFGLITGIIANMLDPKPHENSIFIAMIVGVLGSVMGGLLANIMLGGSITGFNLSTFLIAVVGSLSLLIVSRTMKHI